MVKKIVIFMFIFVKSILLYAVEEIDELKLIGKTINEKMINEFEGKTIDEIVKRDEFINQTIDELFVIFGNPDNEIFKTIWIIHDKSTIIDRLASYSTYLSKKELFRGVQVRFVMWEKEGNNIYIWLKNINNEWRVFRSLEWPAYLQF